MVLTITGAAWAGASGAAPATGPTIALDRTSVQVGQRLYVTLTGWNSRVVTISACSNLARRGSGDCNLEGSQSLTLLNSPRSTLTELTIFAPPGTCPCVIRASSSGQDEVAVVPIDIVGLPTGPVVAPTFDAPVSVSIKVRSAHAGLIAAIRSALGGPTSFLVTASVRNMTSETLNDLSLSGSVGRSENDTAASFDFARPGPLGAGKTWAQTVRVRVPAPVINRSYWHIAASGAGQPADAQLVTHRMPVAFVVLVVVLVVDVVAMICYFAARYRLRRRDERRRQQVAMGQTGFDATLIPS